MPRQARKKSETGIHHVMIRGVNRQTIFADDEDYNKFINTIQQSKEKSNFKLIIASLAGLRKIDILRKIRKAMMQDVDMPVDLLVYDDAEFNERVFLAATMEHKIAHEGVLLYEQ